MDYLLIGQSMRLDNDGERFALAFADSAAHPRRHVVLRKSGHDGLHLEIDHRSRSACHAISSIDVREDRARIFLTPHGQAALGCESVVVAFTGTDLRPVFGVLACVADDEFPIRESGAPPAMP